MKMMVIGLGCIILALSGVFSRADAGGGIDLSQTGQKKCYGVSGGGIDCKGTAQDAEVRAGVAWPDPRFTRPDGLTPINTPVIADRLTGLMWTRDAGSPSVGPCTGGPMEWPQAMDYVKCLNTHAHLGYTDWRLPNVNELESMIQNDSVVCADWLRSQGFINVHPESYWTSTASDGIDVDVWNVYLLNGIISTSFKWTYQYYAWPVRNWERFGPPAPLWKTGQTHTFRQNDDGDLRKGHPWPDPRFRDHGDGTVTDLLTGLMWTKEANPAPPSCPSPQTWSEALDFPACLNRQFHLGHNDWRLPNKKALFSLIDYSMHSPALPAGHPFLNAQPGPYWSSTTYAYAPDKSWVVHLWNGSVGAGEKTTTKKTQIWPVRGGKLDPNGPDLTGIWISLTQACRDSQSGMRCRIQGTFNLQNIGNQDAPSTYINFYLSETGVLDGKEVLLKQVATGRVMAGKNRLKILSHALPKRETGSGKYILAVIDEDHLIVETNKKNNLTVFGPLP